MFTTWRRTIFAACLVLTAALGFFAHPARADRGARNDRGRENHSRVSHARSHHASGDREPARGVQRRGRFDRGAEGGHHGSQRASGHHRWAMSEHGRGGRHHWAMGERGRGGHHRYAAHNRPSHHRPGWESAHRSRGGWRHRGEGTESSHRGWDRGRDHRGHRDRARSS
ncbi:MAG TPA: hypothetical protein VFF52_23265 [Isosphaeraceae bacterium]|nr:hypothetical protein [Isosphaeraceae bacterium]